MIRAAPRILFLTVAWFAAGLAGTATAQVAVDQGALDRLQPNSPAANQPGQADAPARHEPAPPAHHKRRPPPKAAAQPAASKPAAKTSPPQAASTRAAIAKPPPTPAKPAPVVLAPAPPPPVSLVTPALPPPHTVPEAPIPVTADAAGGVSKILGGLRVTFGAGSADLNPTTEAALRSIARTIGADPAATFNLYAYAAGTADDPSTPRRLSLSRALAARAVLINEGIGSTRIYPHAMGANVADGPPDRVDVTQVGIVKAPS